MVAVVEGISLRAGWKAPRLPGRKFKLQSAAERLPLFYRALPSFHSQH